MNSERIKEIETDFALDRFVSPNDLLRICDLARDGLTAREGGVTLREAIDAANSALTHAADDPDGPVIDAAAISVVTALRVLAAQKAGERGPGSDRASEQANATATPAALDATPSLAARAEGGAVGVKALEWKEEVQAMWWSADYYRIEKAEEDIFAVRLFDTRTLRTYGRYHGLDAAKAAAQADYDTRIRSALVLTPAGAEAGEAIGFTLRQNLEKLERVGVVNCNLVKGTRLPSTRENYVPLYAAPASSSAIRAEALTPAEAQRRVGQAVAEAARTILGDQTEGVTLASQDTQGVDRG